MKRINYWLGAFAFIAALACFIVCGITTRLEYGALGILLAALGVVAFTDGSNAV